MTKPRQSTTRELFGILGSHPKKSMILKEWNKYFLEKGIDAFMDSYPVKGKDLSANFSDMFLFDRRAYLISPNLQESVLPYLDEIDGLVNEEQGLNLVINKNGILVGYVFHDESVDGIYKFICKNM